MLSTPPAFILSQDQTLNKSFFRPDQRYLLIWLLLFCLGICSLKSRRSGCLRAFSLESSGLHCCLLIKVRLLSSSWRQLCYNNTAAITCQHVFKDFFDEFKIFFSLPFWRWNYIISRSALLCQCLSAVFNSNTVSNFQRSRLPLPCSFP